MPHLDGHNLFFLVSQMSVDLPDVLVGELLNLFLGVLDFIFAFTIAGYAIAYVTGDLTKDGFSLHGLPALLLFAAIAIYFVAFSRYLGGTFWQRLLGVK